MKHYINKSGFTLIELSIVLVIIGLIVGGVLVGQDLIAAAKVRAQISQIEQYQTAVNTFKLKYGYLPGDIPEPAASGFGFSVRGTLLGQGDGNELIEGNCKYNGSTTTYCSGTYSLSDFQGAGETGLFWVDLSKANLIDGTFSTAVCCNWAYGGTSISSYSTPSIQAFIPSAKIGNGFSIVVGNGKKLGGNSSSKFNANNFFILSQDVHIYQAEEGGGVPALSVRDSYSIDKKIDDGIPQTGNVIAAFWANSAPFFAYMRWVGASSTTATPPSSTTCYDNGGVNGATQQYSIGQNDGAGLNCALSFRFQ